MGQNLFPLLQKAYRVKFEIIGYLVLGTQFWVLCLFSFLTDNYFNPHS